VLFVIPTQEESCADFQLSGRANRSPKLSKQPIDQLDVFDTLQDASLRSALQKGG